MQHAISLVGGLMLGIGVFHLFPHSLHYLGDNGIDPASQWMMGGIVFMFFLLRAFHFHQHEFPEPGASEPLEATDSSHQHSESCNHGHHHGDVHEMSWLGVFIGLAIHTLIDGLALGASVQAESLHSSTFGLFGLGTFAAIALHKPLDAVSITSLMKAGGWSNAAQWAINLFYSLLCPIGAIAFVLGMSSLGDNTSYVVGLSLAFAAGVFICIALSDLLPEMEFHSHHRYTLSAALLLGIVLAWAIRYLEPAHVH